MEADAPTEICEADEEGAGADSATAARQRRGGGSPKSPAKKHKIPIL
jgi:hypothetical protein